VVTNPSQPKIHSLNTSKNVFQPLRVWCTLEQCTAVQVWIKSFLIIHWWKCILIYCTFDIKVIFFPSTLLEIHLFFAHCQKALETNTTCFVTMKHTTVGGHCYATALQCLPVPCKHRAWLLLNTKYLAIISKISDKYLAPCPATAKHHIWPLLGKISDKYLAPCLATAKHHIWPLLGKISHNNQAPARPLTTKHQGCNHLWQLYQSPWRIPSNVSGH
jgi:hypothetical protein